MKRLIALFIVVLLIIPCFSVNSQESEAVDTQFESMTELLRLTGVLSSDDDSFSLRDVSRGEFAAYLVRLKGIGEYFGDYERNSFYDVDSNVANYREIFAAKDMGLINGYSDGSFRPEEPVNLIEAAVCMIRVLGYSIKADGLGGYPGGYYEVIRELKLTEGVEGAFNESLKFNDLVQLMFNTLHTNIMEKTEFGDKTKYEVVNGNTLLNNSFGISYIDGIVNGIDITSIFGDNSVPPYHVSIDEELFCVGNYNIEPMLGFYVRAYYKTEDSNEMIKLVIPSEKKNKVTSIELKNISDISNEKVSVLYEDGSKMYYSYNKNAAVIYNGANTRNEFNKEIFKDKDGEILSGRIKLLDNNGDGKADVVFIDAYENIVVGKAELDTGLVYDYYNKQKVYNLNTVKDDPYVIIYDTDGMESEHEVIEIGTSIVIYDSMDDSYQKYTRAYISEKTVTGKVEAIGEEEGRSYAIINGNKYYVSDYALKNSGSVIPGRTVDALLNVHGEIVKSTYPRNPGDYDYALLCKISRNNSFEAKTYMKLMDGEKNIITLTAAEKIKLDNNYFTINEKTYNDILYPRLENAAFLLAASGDLPSDGYVFQMVKYGINDDGEINYIDTVLDEDGTQMKEEDCRVGNELFFGIINGLSTYYSSAQKVLGLSVVVNSGSKIYMYPAKGNEADYDYYDVRTDYFKGSTQYPNTVYFRDSKADYSSSVFMKQYQPAPVSGDLATFDSQIVTKVTDCIDSEGLKAKKWYLFDQGTRTEIIVNPDMISRNSKAEEKIKASEVNPGDIVYIVTDSVTGEIEGFLMMYSYENDYESYTYSSYNEILKADILEIKNNHVNLLMKYKGSTGTVSEYNTVFNYPAAENCITVFDTKSNHARIGNISDLTAKADDPVNYNQNVIVRRYQPAIRIIREIYIYE